MSNSLRLTKKAFTIAIATATILWTAGLAAFVPTQAQAAEYGDLIMGETLSTVYYYGSDGLRYSFPTEKTYFSWYADFDDVVQISDEELADISPAGNIVYRPGSRWIKITSDEKVYAVSTDGTIHWIETAEVAEDLAGSNWNQFIDDVPDVYFTNYTVGDSITDASEGYNGMLWTDGDDTYLVWDGEVSTVSSAGMSANGFQDGFVLDGDGFDVDSLDEGDAVTGELAYLTDAAQAVEDEEYEETQVLEVSLSDDSPAASTLVTTSTNTAGATPGQAIAHLASYDFENSTDDDVVVTKVILTRKGVSADTTLVNVYLFDGWLRLSDSATVSSGSISWNDSSGLLTIPAGETVTVAVRADLLTGTSGQTVGVSLDPDDLVFKGSYDATGPAIASATHTIATVSNFGTVSFATATNPASDGTPTPENDFRIWENNVSIGNNEAWLYALRFRNIGSINADDLGNWELYVAGVKKGATVTEQNADGYVVFDLSADPVKMNTGTHAVKVLVDVWGGSTRTATVGLRSTADAVFVEDDYDQPILVQANTGTFSARDAAAQTFASGDLTFTKKTTSASGDVINGASNASLGSFEVKATGEAMKIESLGIQIDEGNTVTTLDDDTSGADSIYTLRNGALYVDGTQVGSTAAIAGDGDATLAYTTYTFGSSFIVYPGSPVTLEIKADVYDSDTTNDIDATDTIQVQIDAGSASSNALRMTSGSYISRPATDVEANTLTVRTGSLTTAKNTSYANQSAVAPKTEYKIGSWTITANTTESVNLTQFDLDFSAAVAEASASADYSNLYLAYGPNGDETETSAKTSVSISSNVWTLNYTLDPGETIYVNAYANVATTVAGATAGDDIISADLDVDGTAASSSTSIDGSDVTGQAMSWYASGSFTTSLDGSTSVAKAVAAGQTIEAAKFRFTSLRENYTVDQIQVSVNQATVDAGVVSSAQLYDGSTLLGSAVFATTSGDSITNGAALVTGLNISIPAGSYKVITAKLVLNDIGAGGANSQANAALSLDHARYRDSQGAVETDATDRDGSEIRAYNSIPTFTGVDLTNSTVVNNQPMDLYKFTVSANSNGSVAIKQFGFPVSWTDADADVMEMESWKVYKNGSDITTSVLIQDQVGASIEGTAGAYQDDTDRDADSNVTDDNEAVASEIYVTWASEDVVSAGETVTYTLRATPQGFDSDGDTGDEDFFSIYLASDATNLGTVGVSDVCLEETATYTTIFALDDAATAYGTCAATSTNATAYNVIWSDSSDDSHLTTADGSSDWANGYLLLNLDLSGETWAK